jgi:hypothetical protein
MTGVADIELALRRLPRQDQWRIARWLLDELEDHTGDQGDERPPATSPEPPDYAARRRNIFGDKVLPNMVLAARTDERW